MNASNDVPDFQLLCDISRRLENDYDPDFERWDGSPFYWLAVHMHIRTLGMHYENLLSAWCEEKGLHVTKAIGTGADRVVGGQRTEIKVASLSKSGTYVFNQIRDQDYGILLCLESWPETDRIMARGYTPGNQG